MALQGLVPGLPIKLKQELRPNPQGMMPVMISGDCWAQKHIEGGAPAEGLWHSRQAAIKREQCVLTAESQVMEQKEVAFAVQQYVTHLSAAMNKHVTMEELLGVMFSVCSMLMLYEDQVDKE
jgi:hypothetical protein